MWLDAVLKSGLIRRPFAAEQQGAINLPLHSLDGSKAKRMCILVERPPLALTWVDYGKLDWCISRTFEGVVAWDVSVL